MTTVRNIDNIRSMQVQMRPIFDDRVTAHSSLWIFAGVASDIYCIPQKVWNMTGGAVRFCIPC